MNLIHSFTHIVVPWHLGGKVKRGRNKGETDRQTDRQKERQTDRQTEKRGRIQLTIVI